jgi:hypothetical protein
MNFFILDPGRKAVVCADGRIIYLAPDMRPLEGGWDSKQEAEDAAFPHEVVVTGDEVAAMRAAHSI